MTLGNLSPRTAVPIVSAYQTSSSCNINAWTPDAASNGVRVQVTCQNASGAQDAMYNVMYLTSSPQATPVPSICSTLAVGSASAGVAAGDFTSGAEVRISSTGEVSLASDDAYSTSTDGNITKAPSVGSGAYNYFINNALPLNVAPTVGIAKTPADSAASLRSAPFGALLGGWAKSGSVTPPAVWFVIGPGNQVTVPNLGDGTGGARLSW